MIKINSSNSEEEEERGEGFSICKVKKEPLGDQIEGIAFFAVSFGSQRYISYLYPLFLRLHLHAAAHRHLRHPFSLSPYSLTIPIFEIYYYYYLKIK